MTVTRFQNLVFSSAIYTASQGIRNRFLESAVSMDGDSFFLIACVMSNISRMHDRNSSKWFKDFEA